MAVMQKQSKNPIFDPQSAYSQLRVEYPPQAKVYGAFLWSLSERELRNDPELAQLLDLEVVHDHGKTLSSLQSRKKQVDDYFQSEPRHSTPGPHAYALVCSSLSKVVPCKLESMSVIPASTKGEDILKLRFSIPKAAGQPARLFILEKPARKQIWLEQGSLPGDQAKDVLEKLFSTNNFSAYDSIGFILASLPDLDGETDQNGIVEFCANIPKGSAENSERPFDVDCWLVVATHSNDPEYESSTKNNLLIRYPLVSALAVLFFAFTFAAFYLIVKNPDNTQVAIKPVALPFVANNASAQNGLIFRSGELIQENKNVEYSISQPFGAYLLFDLTGEFIIASGRAEHGMIRFPINGALPHCIEPKTALWVLVSAPNDCEIFFDPNDFPRKLREEILPKELLVKISHVDLKNPDFKILGQIQDTLKLKCPGALVEKYAYFAIIPQ